MKKEFNKVIEIVIGIVIVTLFVMSFQKVTTHETANGSYTCRGTVVQMCSTDSQVVYEAQQWNQ